MNTYLDSFARAVKLGSPHPGGARGLCGRIIRGKKPEDFRTLTDDPNRKLVMLLGADGLAALPGKSGYEMLLEIGYTEDHIRRKVIDEGNQFKLVVFGEGGEIGEATWDHVVDIVARMYPTVASKLWDALPALKNTPFAEISRRAGFDFAQVDKAGPADPNFVTIERFVRANGDVVSARAFLYFTVHLRELFAGDGYTYTADGRRGLTEYIVPNRPLSDLDDHVVIDLDIQVPNTGVPPMKTATKRRSTAAPAYEPPIPGFFDPKKVGDWKWLVKYAERFKDAIAWAKRHSVTPSALDGKTGPRIALLPIDCQLTFCHPDFELFVGGQSGTGAIDDTTRLCEFILRNLKVLTSIHPTMDTHLAYQIFHAGFIVDENGNHPDPTYPTLISRDDIVNGKWKIDPKVAYAVTGNAATYSTLQAHLVHYAETLAQGGKYALTIWPFHAMLGGHGHALVPSLEEVIFFHSIARGAQTDFQIKGGNPLTENYSVLRPEVLTTVGGKPLANAQKNTKFLKTLLDNDVVIIAGQAKSHCVAWTIEDLLAEIMSQDPALVKKVYLLEDCTSPVVVPGVVDFTTQGDDAFRRFAAAGMHVVESTTPIEEWPDVTL